MEVTRSSWVERRRLGVAMSNDEALAAGIGILVEGLSIRRRTFRTFMDALKPSATRRLVTLGITIAALKLVTDAWLLQRQLNLYTVLLDVAIGLAAAAGGLLLQFGAETVRHSNRDTSPINSHASSWSLIISMRT